MSKFAVLLFMLSVSASGTAHNAPDVSALKLPRKSSLSPTSRYHLSYPYPMKSNPQKEQHRINSHLGDPSLFPASATNHHDVHSGGNNFGYWSIGQENWHPFAWNNSYIRYRTGHHREPVEVNRFSYKYQYIPHPQQAHFAYKKPFYYYGKGKFFKAPENMKQKKFHYIYDGRTSGFKKAPYQRVYTPNAIYTYPVKKNGYQYYRRYYQTHFIPASEMLRTKMKNFRNYGEDLSTTSPASTTDRISRNHSITSEVTSYNGTYSFGSGSNSDYYTNQEKAETDSFPELTTRVHFGDRKYRYSKVPYQKAEGGFGHRSYVTKGKQESKEEGAGPVLNL